MGKYESMLRRMTQVEISMGIMRSRFKTYPPQQFDLTVLEEDVLDTPITLGNHVVASGPRTLEERIKSDRDWEQWLASVCHDFRHFCWFSAFFFLSPKRPLI